VARPPVATERLARLPDGRLLYRLKHRWRDGTSHVVFEPLVSCQCRTRAPRAPPGSTRHRAPLNPPRIGGPVENPSAPRARRAPSAEPGWGNSGRRGSPP
jgi:hypothetical protein